MAWPDLKPPARFFGAFALLYALLIFPWPGVREVYSGYFCSFARLVLSESSGDRILRFDTVPADQRNRTLDTRITIANRTQLAADGSGRAVMLDLDSRGIGWVPTALLIALVVATPIPWRRRGLALLWGLLAVHALIFLALQVFIWDNSDAASGLSLVVLTPFWKAIVAGLDESLVTQLGASFVIPLLIWIMVTIRAENITALFSRLGFGGLRQEQHDAKRSGVLSPEKVIHK